MCVCGGVSSVCVKAVGWVSSVYEVLGEHVSKGNGVI